MFKPKQRVPQLVELKSDLVAASRAAERQKNAAHSVSCGSRVQNTRALKGRPMTLVASAVLLFMSLSALAQSPNEQLPAGPAKAKAEAACQGCHEARIIVQQRLAKPAWEKEVDKMTKWGAEVDPKDRDTIIDYFSANFGPDKPAYQAPRSASESKSKTKAKP